MSRTGEEEKERNEPQSQPWGADGKRRDVNNQLLQSAGSRDKSHALCGQEQLHREAVRVDLREDRHIQRTQGRGFGGGPTLGNRTGGVGPTERKALPAKD